MKVMETFLGLFLKEDNRRQIGLEEQKSLRRWRVRLQLWDGSAVESVSVLWCPRKGQEDKTLKHVRSEDTSTRHNLI